MGMQIRIPSPRIAVRKRRGHQARDVDLPDPVPALSREQCMAFNEAECILHGCLMGPLDLCRHLQVGDRPQRRYRLHRREGQVITGNRLGARPRSAATMRAFAM